MEGMWGWRLVTAIAPVAWGTNYYVTNRLLPADGPLFGSAVRALPAGLLLLALCRQRPRGAWWWRSAVLGTLNVGAFFALVYVAAQRLPTSVASTVMATSPLVIMLVAWGLVAERPRLPALGGAGIGLAGVALMLSTGSAGADAAGVLASVTAMVMSSFGYVLAKRWGGRVDVLASTSWQLIAGGVMLAAGALVVEGRPPELDTGAVLGFGYVTSIATAVAFVAWFSGLRHLPAGTVGLIGLLNPVTGVLLGTLLASEALTVQQGCGIALVFGGILVGNSAAGRSRAGWAVRHRREGQDPPRAVAPAGSATRTPAGAPKITKSTDVRTAKPRRS